MPKGTSDQELREKVNGPQDLGAVRPAVEPQAGYADNVSAVPPIVQDRRVRMYVDGFNLYYGLHDSYRRRYLWLDLWALGESFLRPGQVLEEVYYFTARRRNDPSAQANQAVYLGALKARGVRIREGRFQEKQITCRACGGSHLRYEEKESDVSFCVQLVEDAASDAFDVAFLVTADSDMVPAVKAAKRLAPHAHLVALMPPGRNSNELKKHVHASMTIGQAKIRQARLPDPVLGQGRSFNRPSKWV